MSAIDPKKFRLKKRAHVIRNSENQRFYYYPIRDMACLAEYYMNHLIIDERLREAEQGIYTWVMVDPQRVYALRTYSNQEIGSLHDNIMAYIQFLEKRKPTLIASGEMELSMDASTGRPLLEFNFQSSLFVSNVLKKETKKRKQTENEVQADLSKQVRARFQELCPSHDIRPVLGKDLIEDTQFLTHPSRIELFERCLTRYPLLPQHQGKTYRRVVVNRLENGKKAVTNAASNTVSNTVAATAAASASSSNQEEKDAQQNNNNNRPLQSLKKQKSARVQRITSFQPSEPLTGFHMGTTNSMTKKKGPKRKGGYTRKKKPSK